MNYDLTYSSWPMVNGENVVRFVVNYVLVSVMIISVVVGLAYAAEVVLLNLWDDEDESRVCIGLASILAKCCMLLYILLSHYVIRANWSLSKPVTVE